MLLCAFQPNIFYGRSTNVGQLDEDRDFLVNCPRAVQFYHAAKKVEGLEYLAVVQVEGSGDHLKEDSVPNQDELKQLLPLSTAKYVYTLIRQLVEVL